MSSVCTAGDRCLNQNVDERRENQLGRSLEIAVQTEALSLRAWVLKRLHQPHEAQHSSREVTLQLSSVWVSAKKEVTHLCQGPCGLAAP